jgi:hypothetical protein
LVGGEGSKAGASEESYSNKEGGKRDEEEGAATGGGRTRPRRLEVTDGFRGRPLLLLRKRSAGVLASLPVVGRRWRLRGRWQGERRYYEP